MPNPSTTEASGLNRAETLEELRRSFKRLENYSRKMAREMGRIEDLSRDAGIPVHFTVTPPSR